MPLITVRSSPRATTHGLYGSKGATRLHRASANQTPFVVIQLPQFERLNQSFTNLGILFMIPVIRASAASNNCVLHRKSGLMRVTT